ncbi:MAG: DAK2 domain-containing protein, partial [Caldisericaceae bacterium]
GSLNYLGLKREEVNKLNVFPVPDGDTGTNMYLTLKTAIESIDKANPKNLKEYGKIFCEGTLIGGRGNSGVILSQIIKGFFDVIDNVEKIDVKLFSMALQNATKIAYQAVIKPVEGTILTIVRSMAQASLEVINEEDFIEYLSYIIEEAKRTLEKTPQMLPVLKEAGVIDAGGQGLIYLLEGGLKSLKGEAISELKEEVYTETVKAESLEFKFDTVLLCYLNNYSEDVIKKDLEQFGDSIVVATANDLTKIHIHSNEPNKVIAYILDKGEIKEARIENMQLQTEEFAQKTMEKPKKIESRFDFSIVCVSQGEGFKKIFESLGVEEVIEGGQTMNPSMQDILNAVEKCSKDTVFVFPNNSNIILAANEAKKHSNRKRVEIVPTKNPAQTIPIILNFNQEESIEENLSKAVDMIKKINIAEVTYSIRNTTINGLEIKENDFIGLFDDNIVVKGSTPEDTFLSLLQTVKEKIENTEFISIYYGKDAKKEDGVAMIEKLSEIFKNIEFDLVYGGQPFYYYIASIE